MRFVSIGLLQAAMLMLMKDVGLNCMLATNLYAGEKYVGEIVCWCTNILHQHTFIFLSLR